MDLGECSKIHDLALRADYEIASKERDLFFELDVSVLCLMCLLYELVLGNMAKKKKTLSIQYHLICNYTKCKKETPSRYQRDIMKVYCVIIYHGMDIISIISPSPSNEVSCVMTVPCMFCSAFRPWITWSRSSPTATAEPNWRRNASPKRRKRSALRSLPRLELLLLLYKITVYSPVMLCMASPITCFTRCLHVYVIAVVKAEKVHELNEEIGKLLAKAEQLGAEGNVDEAQKVLQEVEKVRTKKKDAEVSVCAHTHKAAVNV